jgi:hypothetical protein
LSRIVFQGTLTDDTAPCHKESLQSDEDEMGYSDEMNGNGQVIGTIANKRNPDQVVEIVYLRNENAFCTSGIRSLLNMKEILIPVYMVANDFQLVGAIISAILERISVAKETGISFEYAHRFEVVDRVYTLSESGDFMKLEWE